MRHIHVCSFIIYATIINVYDFNISQSYNSNLPGQDANPFTSDPAAKHPKHDPSLDVYS